MAVVSLSTTSCAQSAKVGVFVAPQNVGCGTHSSIRSSGGSGIGRGISPSAGTHQRAGRPAASFFLSLVLPCGRSGSITRRVWGLAAPRSSEGEVESLQDRRAHGRGFQLALTLLRSSLAAPRAGGPPREGQARPLQRVSERDCEETQNCVLPGAGCTSFKKYRAPQASHSVPSLTASCRQLCEGRIDPTTLFPSFLNLPAVTPQGHAAQRQMAGFFAERIKCRWSC